MRITIEIGIPSWARAWQRRMIDAARLFRRFWFLVLMALWLDLIFMERLVVDYRLWLHDESDGWSQAMSHPGVVLYGLVAFPLLLAGLTLTDKAVASIIRSLLPFVHSLRRDLFNLRQLVVLVVLFLSILTVGVIEGRTLGDAVSGWLSALGETTKHLLIIAGVALSVAAATVVLRWALKFLKSETYREAYVAWLTAFPAFLLNWVLYFLLYEVSLGRSGEVAHLDLFWEGFAKDSVIYSVIGLFLIGGLYRWTQSQAIQRLTYNDRWVSLVVFVIVSLVLAMPALVLDMLAYGDLNVAGSTIYEAYPGEWRRDIVGGHILFRDFILLVPLVFAIHLWVMSRILLAQKMPDALLQYGRTVGLSYRELRELTSIRYLGRQPRTVEEWKRVHEALASLEKESNNGST